MVWTLQKVSAFDQIRVFSHGASGNSHPAPSCAIPRFSQGPDSASVQIGGQVHHPFDEATKMCLKCESQNVELSRCEDLCCGLTVLLKWVSVAWSQSGRPQPQK